MIKAKEDYKLYLIQDALALNEIERKHPRPFTDYIWRFQRMLRKCEYQRTYNGLKRIFCMPSIVINKIRFNRMSVMLGFSIPLGVFEEGLSIAHYGNVTVSASAKVGKNCRIHEGVNIGATNGSVKAPIIGNNVFIGTGAKIIGDISVADDVAIGANSVVVKSISESGTTWAGVPARKISSNNSHSNLSKYLSL